MKYRKRPVEVEAERVPTDEDMEAWGRLSLWLGPGGPWQIVEGRCIAIETLEGTMRARPGDWIVRGVQGELYPVKPDVFEATYEPAEQTAAAS